VRQRQTWLSLCVYTIYWGPAYAYQPPRPKKGDHVENRDRLLTPGEVASLFRVDPKTVTRWAASGRIGSIRTPGGHRRFRESEVRALLRGDGDLDSIGSLALEVSEG
jgi:excisionase family DNA binding protein